jgi:hypothetical protein
MDEPRAAQQTLRVGDMALALDQHRVHRACARQRVCTLNRARPCGR